MRRYAEGTSVPVDKSKQEIEATLKRYGADQFMLGWEGEKKAMIGFRCQGRFVKFILSMPDVKSDAKRESEWRRRWRCLNIAIKAKLDVVESGISTFEDEFLSYIQLPNNTTVGQFMLPQIAESYKTGNMPKSLLGLPGPENAK